MKVLRKALLGIKIKLKITSFNLAIQGPYHQVYQSSKEAFLPNSKIMERKPITKRNGRKEDPC